MCIVVVYDIINYMVAQDDVFVLSERGIGEDSSKLLDFICFTDDTFYGNVDINTISKNSDKC